MKLKLLNLILFALTISLPSVLLASMPVAYEVAPPLKTVWGMGVAGFAMPEDIETPPDSESKVRIIRISATTSTYVGIDIIPALQVPIYVLIIFNEAQKRWEYFALRSIDHRIDYDYKATDLREGSFILHTGKYPSVTTDSRPEAAPGKNAFFAFIHSHISQISNFSLLRMHSMGIEDSWDADFRSHLISEIKNLGRSHAVDFGKLFSDVYQVTEPSRFDRWRSSVPNLVLPLMAGAVGLFMLDTASGYRCSDFVIRIARDLIR